MSTSLPEVPDCSAVSQLPPLEYERLSSETLLLVSQPVGINEQNPDAETDTGYISRHVKLSRLEDHVKTAIGVSQIEQDLQEIKNDAVRRSELSVSGLLSASCAVPYILSSFILDCNMVQRVGGYPLSAGVKTVIDDNKYIPNRLSVFITIDETNNEIAVRNSDSTIYSKVSLSSYVKKSDFDALQTRVAALVAALEA